MKVEILRKEYSNKEVFEDVVDVIYSDGFCKVIQLLVVTAIPIESIVTLWKYK